ncbi:MAG: S4 domain-containing protein, partial [Casimicrobiaceae bacterium]
MKHLARTAGAEHEPVDTVVQRSAGKDPPRHIRVGESHAGQRVDNYLIRELTGVPKSHIYRIIRSGEVRIKGARVRAETKLAAGDELRLPPLRLALPSAASEVGIKGGAHA